VKTRRLSTASKFSQRALVPRPETQPARFEQRLQLSRDAAPPRLTAPAIRPKSPWPERPSRDLLSLSLSLWQIVLDQEMHIIREEMPKYESATSSAVPQDFLLSANVSWLQDQLRGRTWLFVRSHLSCIATNCTVARIKIRSDGLNRLSSFEITMLRVRIVYVFFKKVMNNI